VKPRSVFYCNTSSNQRSWRSTTTQDSIWPKETEVRRKKSGSQRRKSQKPRPRSVAGPDRTPLAASFTVGRDSVEPILPTQEARARRASRAVARLLAVHRPEDTHCVRLASLENGLDGVSPHPSKARTSNAPLTPDDPRLPSAARRRRQSNAPAPAECSSNSPRAEALMRRRLFLFHAYNSRFEDDPGRARAV
jgi:hypothetical protein